MSASPRRDPLPTLRRTLGALYLLGAGGTGAELILVEHYEDPWQLVPLALLGAGLLALAGWALSRQRAVLGIFRALMVVYLPAGLLGLYQHYGANVEFAAETYPELGGLALFWDAVRGASPPSLAPGALLLLALAGLGYAHQHPASARPEANTDTKGAIP